MENWLANWSKKNSAKVKILKPSFYKRDTLVVAKELLGKILLICSKNGKITAGRIVEVEAYSEVDPASHSAKGETPRSSVMFGEPGVAYVYFIYGMYEMLNFVTEKKGIAGAVLIRALEPVYGEDLMKKRRKITNLKDLTSGPGKLARALGITMAHNKKSLQGPELYVIDDGSSPEVITASKRVGISRATDLEWRFFLPDNPFVSRAKENRGSQNVRN